MNEFDQNDQDVVDGLYERFVREHRAGDVPDPNVFAREASENGELLLDMIGLYLKSAPVVWPSDAAVTRLAAIGESSGALGAVKALVADWASATLEGGRRLAGKAALEGGTADLRIATAVARTASTANVIPLRQGARVEITDTGTAIIVFKGLPDELIGTRPILAFPLARDKGGIEFEWADEPEALPPGLVRAAEPVGDHRVLKVELGCVGPTRHGLQKLLSEIWIVTEDDDRD